MRPFARTVLTLVVAVALVGVVAVVLAYAGVVPVAAGQHHFGLIEWYLETAADHAVDRGGAGVQPPSGVDSPQMLQMGLVHYQEMCVTCHGAPGVEPSEIGKGLYPDPPLLERKKRARLGPTYWIVKNGIRDTGMPAFGATHTEQELWAIAAFAVAMPHMTPEEYARRTTEAGVEMPGAEIEAAEQAAQKQVGHEIEQHQREMTGKPGEPTPLPSHAPVPTGSATPHGSG
jgi:mono/diheme cytochrome c family protein